MILLMNCSELRGSGTRGPMVSGLGSKIIERIRSNDDKRQEE